MVREGGFCLRDHQRPHHKKKEPPPLEVGEKFGASLELGAGAEEQKNLKIVIKIRGKTIKNS